MKYCLVLPLWPLCDYMAHRYLRDTSAAVIIPYQGGGKPTLDVSTYP